MPLLSLDANAHIRTHNTNNTPLLHSHTHTHNTNNTKQLQSYVQDYDEKDPATFKGLDLHTLPTAGLYQHFGLDPQTIDFIGHSIALHR